MIKSEDRLPRVGEERERNSVPCVGDPVREVVNQFEPGSMEDQNQWSSGVENGDRPPRVGEESKRVKRVHLMSFSDHEISY